MDAGEPTIELPRLLPDAGQTGWEAKTKPQADQFGVGSRQREKAGLSAAKDIARAEMMRQRGRLGSLTREQEIEIEHLLMSTVNKVSELAGKVLESLLMMP